MEKKAMKFQPSTIRELLDWSYANLAAYRIALSQIPPAYTRVCWMTRSRLYKGLQSGSMTRQSIYNNEREKLKSRNTCAYCGATDISLTLDHLFAKARHGHDSADNLVYCCQSCNSSKRDTDYFQWVKRTGRQINPDVAERYLKNAYIYCEKLGVLDSNIENAPRDLPFDLDAIPCQYNIFSPMECHEK